MEEICFNCKKKLHQLNKYQGSAIQLCNECISTCSRCKKCGQLIFNNKVKKQDTLLLCMSCRETSTLFDEILEKERQKSPGIKRQNPFNYRSILNEKKIMIVRFWIKLLQKDENFPQIWGSIFLFLLLLSMQFFIGFILFFILHICGVRVYLGDPTHLSITILLSYLIVIYIGSWKNGRDFQNLFPIENIKITLLLPITFTSIGLYLLLFSYHFILNNYAYIDRIEFDFFKALIYPNIYSFGLLVLISPITEELFFRGLLLNGLTRKFDAKHSLALSSLFFAVSHFSVQKLIPIFLLGFFLGWIFLKTKNLFPCMLIHAINNAIAFFHTINSEDVQLIELKTGPLLIFFLGLLTFLAGSFFIFRNQDYH